ncbi:MAG: CYTH and CHAD domain-containing protein, partial [Jatrophihabitans sp.]
YYDTADLGLLSSRLTLRRRTGDDDTGWQFKVPAGDARTEIWLSVEGRGVPAEFRQLTLGVRAGHPLRPVARIRTARDVHVIHGVDGSPLAELVVDDVTAARTGASTDVAQWREVEVELKDGDEALLRRTTKWLRRTGVVPSPYRSKLARALGDAASATDVATDGLAGVVCAYLSAQRDAILMGDLALRREQDAIHTTRVAARRYRSALRVLAELFDDERAVALDAELKWYASVLGTVRDLQVLGGHLRSALAELPDELILGPVSMRLDQTLEKELIDARRELDSAMRSRRYLALLQELQAWAEDPPMTEARTKPAKRVEKYLHNAEKKLDRRLALAHQLPGHDPNKNEALHLARKAAKRARYTAELTAPVLGKAARSSFKAAKRLQTDLGHRHDAVLAVAFLQRVGAVAGAAAGENGFTFGVLLANEIHRGHLD